MTLFKKLSNKSFGVDAVYLPPDSYVSSNAKLIGDKLRVEKIPSIASVKPYIMGGALLGVMADFYQLGKIAA